MINPEIVALEYTRAHYERHSNKYETTEKALIARAEGKAEPLKRFHNLIKRRLIERFAIGATSLLDLACGRGGDILKWIDAGLRKVKGIDLSSGGIEEARKRFDEARQRRPDVFLNYEFVSTPFLGAKEWRETEQYDVVTCMFAIHYFFENEKMLKQFMHNVSINLKQGGYFIGTAPDGKRINECIRHGGVFDSLMLHIEARWKGKPSPFGSPYIFSIADTVTTGEKESEGSYEYLVYQSVLVAVAAEYGLFPVRDYGNARLTDMFEKEDVDNPLKHFRPKFKFADPSLSRASSIFAAFVFQKR